MAKISFQSRDFNSFACEDSSDAIFSFSFLTSAKISKIDNFKKINIELQQVIFFFLMQKTALKAIF